MGRVVSYVVAATLGAAPAAQAAVPKVGAWESGSRTEPRVSFDVRGPVRSRDVQRVSFPVACKDNPSVTGWGSTVFVRVRGSRFTAYAIDSVIRGRFTAKDRAEVTVRSADVTGCKDTRRYVVLHRGRRVTVRTGRFLSVVSGGAAVGLATSAFGRVIRVERIDGSIPAGCTDGSQRPLTLAGPPDVPLVAPIRSSGRFDISAAAGSSITIAGTFDRGSVAAWVGLSAVLPDGVRCTAPTQSLVGSLAFPVSSGGQRRGYGGPPVIGSYPG
jgi:hypothetical protein